MSAPRKVVVVGGGLAGLVVARAVRNGAREAGAPCDVSVLESSERVGGLIRSEQVGGYLCEWAAESVAGEAESVRGLCKELGVELVATRPAAKRRYLFMGGRLEPLPMGPLEAVRTPILSMGGKLRLLAEAVLPGGHAEGDESVLAFARRRLGREVAEVLVETVMSGIFAGDASQLSVSSALPRFAELEREHGSLFRGLVGGMLAKARKGGKAAKAAPLARLVGPTGGMEAIPLALAADLGAAAVQLRSEVATIAARDGGGYRVGLRSGTGLEADVVIVASPSHRTAPILAELLAPSGPAAERALRAIPTVDIAIALLGYPRGDVPHPLDGFGYLVPRREERRILGAVFSSSIFPARAPDGMHLVRAMVGGARDPGAASLPDTELVGLVRQELKAALGVTAAPAFVHLIRHKPAIPQYTLGHAGRLAAIDGALARHPGLFVAGNSYRGVGVNDVVREATAVAARVTSFMAGLGKLPTSRSNGYARQVIA